MEQMAKHLEMLTNSERNNIVLRTSEAYNRGGEKYNTVDAKRCCTITASAFEVKTP